MVAAAQLLPASQQAIMVAPNRPGAPLLQVASALELEGLPITSGAAPPVTPACGNLQGAPLQQAYLACCLRVWAQALSYYASYLKMLLNCWSTVRKAGAGPLLDACITNGAFIIGCMVARTASTSLLAVMLACRCFHAFITPASATESSCSRQAHVLRKYRPMPCFLLSLGRGCHPMQLIHLTSAVACTRPLQMYLNPEIQAPRHAWCSLSNCGPIQLQTCVRYLANCML